MPRIQPFDPSNASGKRKELLEQVQKKMGRIPNRMKTLVHSPAALEAYFGLSGALSQGVISAKLREQIALVIAENNKCDYCLAAHSAIGKMVGLSEAEIVGGRKGISDDKKVQALLHFAKEILKKSGFVSDTDLQTVRRAGFGDEEIMETIAIVSLNVFTNYVNHVAETEVDFPKVPALAG